MLGLAQVFIMTTLAGAPPPKLPAASPLEEQTARWHQKRVERLSAEDGWLTLIGLYWLSEGQSAAGSGEGASVKLPAKIPAQLGTFTRTKHAVSFQPAPGARVELHGKPFAGGAVRTDAEGEPDILRTSSLQLIVIKRGERLGVRVRDSQAEARRQFKGIARFPVSPGWSKDARWEPAEKGKTIPIPNVLGDVEDTPLAGTAIFSHEGAEHRLVATLEGDELFFVFGDLTNRTDTYGAGRFLYADAPKGGRVTLDFNRAYNPPCAFTPYATCPLPVKENKLKLRVEAGEKRYGDH